MKNQMITPGIIRTRLHSPYLLLLLPLLASACNAGTYSNSPTLASQPIQTVAAPLASVAAPAERPDAVPEFSLVYSADSQLYRYSFDLTEPQLLIGASGFLQEGRNAENLSVSPDGSTLLFKGYDPQIGCPTFRKTKNCWLTGPNGFFSLNLQNGEAELVAPYTITGIDWSPDGSRMVYAQLVFDTPLYQSKIMVKPADGGESTQITDGNWVDEYPAWSPDGEWIAFLRFQSPPAGGPECTPAAGLYDECYDPSLYIVHPDGSGLTRLLRHVRMVQTPYNQPSWSSDGKTLTVIAGKNPAEITLVNISTKQTSVFTGYVPSADTPVWSPDGQWLAFSSQMNGSDQVIVLSKDGTLQKVMTREGETGFNPSWSPDSNWLVWIGDCADSPRCLVAARLDGKALIQLDQVQADSRPVWIPKSPDKK